MSQLALRHKDGRSISRSGACVRGIAAALALIYVGVATRAEAATLQVPGSYPTIQAAVNAAVNGDTIVLADGTYTGSGNWNVTVDKTVTIKSANGPAACVVDLVGTGSYGMRLAPGLSAGTLQIEGITFRNGSQSAISNFYSFVDATFRVVNCVFEDFTNPNASEAIVHDSRVGPFTGNTEILGCTFRNNQKQCVSVVGSSNVGDCLFESNSFIRSDSSVGLCYLLQPYYLPGPIRLENCRFLNNALSSTGDPNYFYSFATLYVVGPSVDVLGCEFRGNSADYYGAAFVVSASGRVERCVFTDNLASRDVGALASGNNVVSNCLFANNQAGQYFGAAYGYSQFQDCTFVGNSAGNSGGGGGGFDSVDNCIFWGNTAPRNPQIEGATSVKYSIVQGGYAGLGDLDVDPQFVDPSNGNYRLLATSPARDSGFSYGFAPIDLDGNPRVVNGIVDRGCFEFQGTNTLPTVTCSGSTFELECQCGPSCTEATVAFDYTDADGDGLVAHWTIDGGPEFTSNISADGPPNTGTFTVTAHFGLGTHTIEFWVTDGEGASNHCAATVNVQDTTAATLVVPSGALFLECHVDSFDPMAGVSATDACAGDLTSVIVVDNPVDTLLPGVYTVTYTVTDPSNNTTTATREVVVQDTTPPEITMNGDPFMTIYCGYGWTDPGATALDLCDGTLAVTADSNVNPNMIGLYSVTYTATDDAGNSNSATRFVRVIATVVGFENPMAEMVLDGSGDPPLPDRAFKLGRTLPLKLKLLCGSTPLGEGQVAPPKIVSLVRVGEAGNMTVLDLNSGGSNDNGPNFRWSDPQWVYNLSTAELTAGTYHITIEMPDGQVFVAAFVLR